MNKILLSLTSIITSLIIGCTNISLAQNSSYTKLLNLKAIGRITELPNGNFVSIVKQTAASSSIIYMNQDKEPLWTRNYDEIDHRFGFLYAYGDSYNNIYISANGTDSSQVPGRDQVKLISFNEEGDLRWSKHLTSGAYSFSRTILPYSDTSFLMINDVSKNSGHASLQLLVVDTSGNVLIDKTYINDLWDITYGGIQTTDDGYLIVLSHGKTNNSSEDDDCGLIKFNHDLSIDWGKTYGGPLRDRDDLSYSMSLVEGTDGYYFSTITLNYGAIDYDVLLMKVEKTVGKLLFAKKVGTNNDDRIGLRSLGYFRDELFLEASFGEEHRLLNFTSDGDLKKNLELEDENDITSIYVFDTNVLLIGKNSTDLREPFIVSFDNSDSICSTIEHPLEVLDVTDQVELNSFGMPKNETAVVTSNFDIPLSKNNLPWDVDTLCRIHVPIPPTISQYQFTGCEGDKIEILVAECESCYWYDASDQLLDSNMFSFSTTIEATNLTAINEAGNRSEITLTPIDDHTCHSLQIYELITPNDDQKNDFLKIENIEFYEETKVNVFDSRNQQIFTSDDYKNDWGFDGFEDGTYYVVVSSHLIEKSLTAEVIVKR